MIIVGCGFLGSSLLYQLCWHKIATEIHIYDFDVLTQSDVDLFKLYDHTDVDQLKVTVLANRLTRMFKDISIVPHAEGFNTDLQDIDHEIFDCRDVKQDDFSYTSRFSFDCGYLIIDSKRSGDCTQEYESHNYLHPKDPILVSIAANIICRYIQYEKYKSRERILVSLKKIIPF